MHKQNMKSKFCKLNLRKFDREMMASRCRANQLASLANQYQVSARPCSLGSYPCTATVIYHIRIKPHPEGGKTAVACSLCAGVDVLSFSLGLVQWKKSVVCLVCLLLEAAGRKEGTAGRLSQAYPLIQQDILSPVLLLCLLRGWESSPFSAEGRPAELHTLHSLRLYRARAACLAEGASAHARAHRRRHAHMHGHSDPPPDVTATSKAHWLAT